MEQIAYKKWFTLVVALLLVVNLASIVVFWVDKKSRPPQSMGGPAKFIIHELHFTKAQEEQFMALAQQHQEAIRPIRDKLKDAKDNFFSLLSKPDLSDSSKLAAAKVISTYTEQLDLITLHHFEKVRGMCNDEQKKKFDAIINQVTELMAMPHHGPGPPNRPPLGREPGMAPPPNEQEARPQPHP